MTASWRRIAAVLAAAAVLAPALLLKLPRALDTPLVRDAQDFTHVPLFAGVFLVLRAAARRLGRGAELAAAIGAAAAGGLVELLQGLGSRSASWSDIGWDGFGIALAWSGLVCWRRGRAWRVAHTALVIVLGLAAIGFLARRAFVLRQLEAMMPLLAGFEQPWELDRWHVKEGTRIGRTRAAIEGDWSLEVRTSAGANHPGVAIEKFDEDWRPYRWLEWSVRLPSAEPLDLVVRIDDDEDAAHGMRYTTTVRTLASRQVYRIDLRDVANSLPRHPMHMGCITELHFFLDEPSAQRSFVIDGVRLVPDPGR